MVFLQWSTIRALSQHSVSLEIRNDQLLWTITLRQPWILIVGVSMDLRDFLVEPTHPVHLVHVMTNCAFYALFCYLVCLQYEVYVNIQFQHRSYMFVYIISAGPIERMPAHASEPRSIIRWDAHARAFLNAVRNGAICNRSRALPTRVQARACLACLSTPNAS